MTSNTFVERFLFYSNLKVLVGCLASSWFNKPDSFVKRNVEQLEEKETRPTEPVLLIT